MKKRIKRTVGSTFLSLRNRNFRLFFIGQLISNTGNWLTNVAIILLVLRITHSGFDVGLLTACQYGPIFFFSVWAGAMADRWDKRRLLLITQSLEMLQSIGLAIVAFMPQPSLVALYVLAAIGGMLLAFDNPFRRSFVSEMVPSSDIPNAVILYSTIVNIARIFGPALAGLLVVTLGFGWAFTIDAASYVAVLTAIIMMRPSELHRQMPRTKMKGAIREGFAYITSMPVLWISFVMLTFIGTLAYNFNVTLPLFVTRALYGNEGLFTILFSIFSLGAVVCALIVAQRSLVGIRHVIIGACAVGIAMIFLAFVTDVTMALVVAFLLGMATILYMNATTALAQVESKREMHGRVLSLQSVLMIGTTLIGGPISGWMADVYGSRSPFIFGGIVCLLTAAFGYWAAKTYIPDAIAKEQVLTDSLENPEEG